MIAGARQQEHMKAAVAHTPLSSVLAQYKEAETGWAQDKVWARIDHAFSVTGLFSRVLHPI